MSILADVDRGLEIRAEMEKLKVELKKIETRLHKVALNGEQVELNDADREGRQYLAAGSDKIVPVILTADLIVGEFWHSSARHVEICNALKDQTHNMMEFFKNVRKFENSFESGKKFRLHALEVFGKELAPKFITACIARDKDGIAKSSIKVAWDHAAAKL